MSENVGKLGTKSFWACDCDIGAIPSNKADVATDYETLKHLAAGALSDAKNGGRNKCAHRLVPKLPVDQAG